MNTGNFYGGGEVQGRGSRPAKHWNIPLTENPDLGGHLPAF